jgi:hypothetical protein
MEESKRTAPSAGEQARYIAGAVREEALDVVGTAKEEGRNVVHETRNQLREQAAAETARVADGLRNLGAQMQALAEGRAEEAGDAREYARQAASTVQGWAGRVESRGIQGLTEDMEHFARRRPGVFLAGAAAAGFVLGRFLRGASASNDNASRAPQPGPLPPRHVEGFAPLDHRDGAAAGGIAPIEAGAGRGER